MIKGLNKTNLVKHIVRRGSSYPSILLNRLGEKAPKTLTAIGPIEYLANRKTALFCSIRAPGEAILRAHDMARRMREEGTTVISGFHSSIERECLSILLRGKQPIIVCPARAIERMRIPTECRPAFDAGRILYLSPFVEKPRRVDRDSALYRNELVAALADSVYLAYVQPGGDMERMNLFLRKWGVPVV
jgi:predicted Rossmann fold nucleotide-binding protein DprA/Smf involved in DNA uptake